MTSQIKPHIANGVQGAMQAFMQRGGDYNFSIEVSTCLVCITLYGHGYVGQRDVYKSQVDCSFFGTDESFHQGYKKALSLIIKAEHKEGRCVS